MTLNDFGSRVQKIREEYLNIKQKEFAKELGTSQALISRLESGLGGNIMLVFDIVTYLNNKGMPAHLLFRENFSFEEFTRIAKDEKGMQNVKPVIEKLQGSLQACLKEAIQLENLIFK